MKIQSKFCSFQPDKDVNKQVEKAKNLVSTAAARMQSRFMHGEINPTMLILASSKRTQDSYLETFIASKKKNESKSTYIVDEPQWVIRTDKDSPRKFMVAVGNKFLNSDVLPLDATEEDADTYRNRGYSIIKVPIGYYENFVDDLDVALTDIAGISTSASSRYINGVRIAAVKDESLRNPFEKDVILVGNDPTDETQYQDFFNLDFVDKSQMSKPMFIHLDMSISGDKTGIAGVWITGKKPPTEGMSSNKDLMLQLAFCVSIKAPKGQQISFEKNRNFIRWLKSVGFSIKGVSSDTFQSYDTGQALKNEGFNYEVISVDRVSPSEKICLPYQYLKTTIYEGRMKMFSKGSALLVEELIGLERNNATGKIDHTPNGINSKDSADAFCGSVWNAAQHAEEFAFDFGETLDAVHSVNYNKSDIGNQKQITVDFEQMLMQTMGNLDLGTPIGGIAPTNNNAYYISQGIIPW